PRWDDGGSPVVYRAGPRASWPRIRMVRRAVPLALAVLGPLALTLGPAGAAPPQGGTVVTIETMAPANLNELQGGAPDVVAGPILQTLLTADSTGRYRPLLATRVPSGRDVVDRGGRFSVTFQIRPTARWSDRVPVRSDDVIFTWRTIMSPRTQVLARSGW